MVDDKATSLLLSGTSVAKSSLLLSGHLVKVAAIATTVVVVGVGVGVGVGIYANRKPSSSPSSNGAAEQIAVNIGYNPSTQLAVSWAIASCTNTSTAPVGHVKYGKSASDLSMEAAANVSQYSVYDPTYGAYTSPCFYNTTLDGLAPGTTIFYSVGDDVTGYSAPLSVSTLPPVSTPGVRLVLLGDLGTTGNSSTTIDNILASHRAPGAAPFSAGLFVGDLSYADGEEPVWDIWGRLAQPLLSQIPTVTGVGNHEWFADTGYAFKAFLARTHNPLVGGTNQTLYFSADLGLVHVVFLQGYCPQMRSTKTQPCLANGTAQFDWLVADLAAVDRVATPWVVVTIHQPFVNSNFAHPIATEGRPVQAAIEEVLYAWNVDLVFSGHVHAYERSCRTYNFTCVGDAPYYITIGDGGNREGLADEWVVPQPDYSVYRSASYGHGELTAVNATHLYWIWNQNPSLVPALVDPFWIVKGDPGPVGPGSTHSPVFAPRY